MSEDMRVAEIQAATRIAQAQENTKIAEEYIAALNARNIQAIGNTLHPQVHVVGPAGEVHGKESFLETYQKVFANLEKVDVTSRVSSPNQTSYVYNMFFAAPVGAVQGSTVMTHHEDGQIKKIEMAFNTANLEQYLNQKK
jgi:hypothetical protein